MVQYSLKCSLKKFVLTAMAFAIMSVAFGQDKRYGIESVILKKKYTHSENGVYGEETVFIDDFGRKEYFETVANMRGQMITAFVIIKNCFFYSFFGVHNNGNMQYSRQGTKTEMSKMEVLRTINFLNLSNEIKKEPQIEEKSSEMFLGKECKRYDLIYTLQGQSIETTVLIWQGLILKTTYYVSGNIMIEEVTEIQEDAVIAQEKFELPEGVYIAEK